MSDCTDTRAPPISRTKSPTNDVVATTRTTASARSEEPPAKIISRNPSTTNGTEFNDTIP
jgi:hypothetical protein